MPFLNLTLVLKDAIHQPVVMEFENNSLRPSPAPIAETQLSDELKCDSAVDIDYCTAEKIQRFFHNRIVFCHIDQILGRVIRNTALQFVRNE